MSDNLYTYCVIDKKNKEVKLGSQEFNDWQEQYCCDFNRSYVDFDNDPLDIQRYYCDPDKTYKKAYDHAFFEKLVLCLKERENEFQRKKKLSGEFSYQFVEDEGIKVSRKNECGQDIELFYLRSDQFGFSAPSNEKSHPYDLYIMDSEDKKEAINKVAEWISISRTIGGSFLWPRPFYDSYNPQRGGKINSNRQYYIQDRVDLTLWELYYWYEERDKNTILKRCNEPNSNLDLWLGHFKNFKTYIDFFIFNIFVDEHYKPVSVLTGEVEGVKWGPNGKNPQIEINKALSIDKLEDMLNRINSLIGERSRNIQAILKQSK